MAPAYGLSTCAGQFVVHADELDDELDDEDRDDDERDDEEDVDDDEDPPPDEDDAELLPVPVPPLQVTPLSVNVVGEL